MKQFIFLPLICLFLLACNLGVSQEVQPPTPMLILPTAVPVMEATAVSHTPTPLADNQPVSQFQNLHFATTGNGLPQTNFAAGTEEVFAIWDYVNLADEDVVRRVWTKNGAEWLVREEGWDMAQYGSGGTVRDISVYDFEGSGLESGAYHLALYVNGVYQTEATFEIRTAAAGLSASTETQVAWVQDNNILMLDGWDGHQRELARANEIVELLWLPDGQHLLYVDQQAQDDPNDPPWPHHALWLVDTETAVSHQLSSYDENLHRIALLPGARYLRAIAGTDFGDACFMDRRLLFVELDESYERVALHDLHEFESEWADKPYWFFPEDEGKGISGHEYEVNLTAYCLTAEMGASEEDLGLIGRYRLDLELGTAVKIGNP